MAARVPCRCKTRAVAARAGAVLGSERAGFVGDSGDCCPAASGALDLCLWDQAVGRTLRIDFPIISLRFTTLHLCNLPFFFF